jgi:hypothetical protein
VAIHGSASNQLASRVQLDCRRLERCEDADDVRERRERREHAGGGLALLRHVGTNQTWNFREQKEVTVELTDRIVLNPFAAKRLLLLLPPDH